MSLFHRVSDYFEWDIIQRNTQLIKFKIIMKHYCISHFSMSLAGILLPFSSEIAAEVEFLLHKYTWG